MVGVAINKRKMKKGHEKSRSLSQLILLSSTTASFGNRDDTRGKRNQKNIQVLWKLVPTSSLG
jgi:hypothetical protein